MSPSAEFCRVGHGATSDSSDFPPSARDQAWGGARIGEGIGRLRPAWPARVGHRGLRAQELPVVLRERLGAAVVLAQPEHPAPGVADQPGGLVDHLLHHRADAPALCGVAHRGVLARTAR
jgi:hypothetical protein